MPLFLRSRRFWIVAAFVAIAAVGAAALLPGRGGVSKAAIPKKGPPTLEFSPGDLTMLSDRPVARSLPVSGTLVAARQALVKAKLAVEVRSMLVREGDPVRAGQVIARLDTVDLAARLDQSTGARDASRAQYEIAEKNRVTNQSLLERKFISQNAFDNVSSLASANRASLEAADAQVRVAQKAFHDATVTAPISGIIARKYVQAGEKTQVDAPLFSIVDLDSIELQAIVPAGEVGAIRKGMRARLTVEGMPERSFDATVDRINPATEPGTRSIIVFLTVPNPDHLLKSGMFAEGTMPLGAAAPRPALPASAIRIDAGQPVVWTIEGGKLMRRVIVPGVRDDAAGMVEIRSGVPAGTPVLASKFDSLKEGAPAIALTTAAAVQAVQAAPAAK